MIISKCVIQQYILIRRFLSISQNSNNTDMTSLKNNYLYLCFLKITTTSVAASVKKDKKGMNNVI